MQQFTTLQLIIIWVIPLLFAIIVHEVAHGWVALLLGDRTAQMLGRLTLNPIKHIDPIGTILVPLFLFYVTRGQFIFGWAKPVPVTWENLRYPKRDMALVALAGPFTNLIMAFLWGAIGLIGKSLLLKYPAGALLLHMGLIGILINIALMILNLLPIPPLDGSRVVTSLLPHRAGYYYNRLEPFGIIILLVLLVTKILSIILLPPLFFLFVLIKNLFGI